MKKGITDIKNVMKGGTPITKVIKGTNLIWQRYEPETINFLNDSDVMIPDDNTIYYSGTPQQTTGKNIWTYIDNFIKREKLAGRWSKILTLRPRVGGNALSHAVNLKDPSTYRGQYYGSWVHNGLGSIGNGSNTYMITGFNPIAAGCTDSDIGTSFTYNNMDASRYRVVMGNYYGGNNRISIYVSNAGVDGDMPICFYDYTSEKKYPWVSGGVISVSAIGSTISGVLNGVLQPDLPKSGTLPNEEIAEGGNKWSDALYQNLHTGNIGITVTHKGFTKLDLQGFSNSMAQFESDLNRGNNW